MAPKRIPSRREERTVHAGYLAKAEEIVQHAERFLTWARTRVRTVAQ